MDDHYTVGTVACDHPKGARLTPDRADFYEKAAAAVRAKILRTYHLSADETVTPAAWKPLLAETIPSLLADKSWTRTRDYAIAQSGLEASKAAAMDDAASHILRRYIDASCLTKALLEREDDAISPRDRHVYRRESTREHLIDIYKNHHCNQTEAQLRALGLNRASAHALNGSLIFRSARLYGMGVDGSTTLIPLDEVIDLKREAKVRPTQGPMKGLSPARIDQQVDELGHYWREHQHDLEANYGRACDKARGR